MDFHYVDTAEIKVSIGMTTGQIRQTIDFLTELNHVLEDGFTKQTLISRIMEFQSIYEKAILTIETYAKGRQSNV